MFKVKIKNPAARLASTPMETTPSREIFPTTQAFDRSIVQVYLTYNKHNYHLPWLGAGIHSSTGTGFVISNHDKLYILTNAHVVKDHACIKVRLANTHVKFIANPIIICYQSDIALIECRDKLFLEQARPLDFGGMVRLLDKVITVGFPTGGTELSISKGIVSRIQVKQYSISKQEMLQVQVDSAINPGNSGGPVLSNGKVVGIAFQAIFQSPGLGYMIPMPIIKHFLAEVFSLRPFRGFPELPIQVDTLENALLREHYQMQKEMSGVRISKIDTLTDAFKQLKIDDIILEIEGIKISNSGKTDLPDIGNCIDFIHLFHEKYVDDKVKIKVMRINSVSKKPEILNLSVILDHVPRETKMMAESEHDKMPTYYISSGVCFQPLTCNYMECSSSSVFNDMDYINSAPKKDLSDHFVIINMILDCEENEGYEDQKNKIVKEINGISIRNIRDVIEAMEKNTKSFHCIVLNSGEKIIVKTMSQIENDVLLSKYHIRCDRSDDLLLPARFADLTHHFGLGLLSSSALSLAPKDGKEIKEAAESKEARESRKRSRSEEPQREMDKEADPEKAKRLKKS